MAQIDIFSVITAQPYIFPVYLNTGTLLDLACGKVERCKRNYILNGGISNIFGIGGKSQTYKSTLMDCLMARVLSIYRDIQAIVYDSENNKPGVARYNDFSIDKDILVSNRISLYDTTTDDLNTIHEKVRAIVDYKKKYAKDFMVETPFIDDHGNIVRILIPTFVSIDSLTVAGVQSEAEAVGENEFDDSALNTIWMKSGKAKTLFMRQIVQYARSANIYFVLSAHIGENKVEIGGNPYAKPSKQLQFMSQSDKLKGVGAQFIFLTNTFLNTKNVTTLDMPDHKESYYPAPGGATNPVELNVVNTTITRNKINASGQMVPFVISQYQGLMNTLTNLNYLRTTKSPDVDCLLQQRGANMTDTLYPNVSFSRKTIREKSALDYKLQRALELSAQLIYVKNCYSPETCCVDTSISVEHFVERLMNNSTPMIDDILESRGYWTWSEDKRPLLTIFDIIEMMSLNKVPSKEFFDMARKLYKTDKKEKTFTSSVTQSKDEVKAV